MEQQDDLGKYVMTLSHQLRRRIDAGMASIGITGMQARVLHFILKEREGKEVFQRDIEMEFNLRRPSATGILHLMEQNGLILRESVAHDARLKKLVPTEKAVCVSEQVDRQLAEIEKDLCQGLKRDDKISFRGLCLQMEENLAVTEKKEEKEW
ncbi:MAG TPA: MarR family transcriptional regulator [Candidatus Ruthenibacterium merdavium]|uniref:MarR family transcriptional regulator n=1 Tax=Candidatus Ruthenibacterium merdavium TaxID=2838752 RepID=A0A9D2Q5G2_9FIRM|nr:MarR family transcriptional regulator [Candidatus Ruthenibacterium merdavium]